MFTWHVVPRRSPVAERGERTTTASFSTPVRDAKKAPAPLTLHYSNCSLPSKTHVWLSFHARAKKASLSLPLFCNLLFPPTPLTVHSLCFFLCIPFLFFLLQKSWQCSRSSSIVVVLTPTSPYHLIEICHPRCKSPGRETWIVNEKEALAHKCHRQELRYVEQSTQLTALYSAT